MKFEDIDQFVDDAFQRYKSDHIPNGISDGEAADLWNGLPQSTRDWYAQDYARQDSLRQADGGDDDNALYDWERDADNLYRGYERDGDNPAHGRSAQPNHVLVPVQHEKGSARFVIVVMLFGVLLIGGIIALSTAGLI
jgi:hypothetical protein